MQKWKTVRVKVIESERGWGQKIIERHGFDTLEKAKKFVETFNAEHCPPRDNVPDYYMQARIAG